MNRIDHAMERNLNRTPDRARGLTLIELMVALAIAAILVSVALPAYTDQVRRGSRSAVQSQLVELATLQERIFLNANAYTADVAKAYDGTATGGLGVTGGLSRDGRYTLSATVSGASYTLLATPVSPGPQAGDGAVSLNSAGERRWNNKPW